MASEPVVDRAYAHLTIVSSELSPEQMVDLAGLQPYRSWLRGNPVRDDPRFPNRNNGIEYRSRIAAGLDGQKHLDDLLSFAADNRQ